MTSYMRALPVVKYFIGDDDEGIHEAAVVLGAIVLTLAAFVVVSAIIYD